MNARLMEIYDAYWAGAYRDSELVATLEEVMMHLSDMRRGEPMKWKCCPPPEDRIPSIQNEDEKEGLDPVFPLCQMCTDPADIVCRVTPDSPGLYVCNRCHKGEGFRYITNCYDHHSAT